MSTLGKISGLPEQGYFVQPVAQLPFSDVQHRLGTDRPAGLELECPLCEAPMETLLRLNTQDTRLQLEGLPLHELPLMVCTQHVISEVQYSFTSAGEPVVAELEHTVAAAAEGEGIIEIPDTHPVLLHAVPDRIAETRQLVNEGRLEEAADWAGKFDWEQPQNQIGGTPLLMNRHVGAPACCLCGQTMPFLASVVVGVRVMGEPDPLQLQLLYFLCRRCANVALVADIPVEDYS
ncbi:MAG TPA: hypothetical protein DCY13_25025 [Verrucomicrobiales bacterium]|nr:hypothetical protein [Verrucomicrobiales bacterium]